MSITLDGTNGITAPNVETSGGPVYDPSNILGTVSESAGVPTGAIIERGSNANGEFVKYADGTLICRVTNPLIDHTGTFSSATRLYGVWTFPSVFISPPETSIDCGVDNSGNFIGCSRDDVKSWSTNTRSISNTTLGFSIFFTSGVSTTDARVENVKMIAVGNWF